MAQLRCTYCGKSFLRDLKSRPRRKNYFCSKECYLNYRKDRNIEVTCTVCNKKFKRVLSKVRSYKNHFCSFECYKQFMRRYLVKVKCKLCGKLIIKRKKEIESSKNTFCSPDCMRKYYSGSRSPKYKNGRSMTKRIRRKLMEDRNYTCDKCGKRKRPELLEVHHIDRNTKNNSFENLALLCVECHTLITRGVIDL